MQAQSLTHCGKAKVATTSARRSGLYKPNHLHAVGRKRWQHHQQGGLNFASPITYMLWEGKCGNNISKEVCTLQAQSLTCCGKAKAATTSTRRSGHCKPNHLHSVGRYRWHQHQQAGLDFASQSLTSCGKVKVATTSTRRSGLCKPNHLQAVGRQRWQQHQQ